MNANSSNTAQGPFATANRWLGRLAAAVTVAGFALGMASSASAMTLTKIETGRPGTATFLMEGPIQAGDAANLRTALLKLPANTATAVILNSGGGDVHEGIRLGVLFHDAKIATFVKASGGGCHSACSLAFLAGRDPRTGVAMRVKPSTSQLGFHQFRKSQYDPLKIYTKADFNAEIAGAQEMTKLIVHYLMHIGEDLSKLQLMLKAPAEGMNILSNETTLAQGIAVLNEETGRLVQPNGARPASDRQRISSLN